MENRKNPKAQLENKRAVFFQIGLVIVLAAVFLAFEWKSYYFETVEIGGTTIAEVEEELIPITWSTKVVPPPPPKPALEPESMKLVDDIIDVLKPIDSMPVAKILPIEISKQPEDIIEEYLPYGSIAQMPVFPGCEVGDEEMKRSCTYATILKFIKDNIRYPEELKRAGVEGKLYLEFAIDKNGEVKNIKLLKGIEGGEQLSKASMKAIAKLPRFKPAVQQGRTVGVTYTVPVKFELN